MRPGYWPLILATTVSSLSADTVKSTERLDAAAQSLSQESGIAIYQLLHVTVIMPASRS